MDIVTQGVLGAAVGHAVMGRKLGVKAMGLGFVGGIVPDLDVFLVSDSASLDYWLYHRGITHALVFGPVLGLPLAWLSAAIARAPSAEPPSFGRWYVFWLLVLLTHPLLDLVTHWGTAFLMPFTQTRYGVPAIAVIDPVYTLLLLAVLVAALVKGARTASAQHLVLLGLSLTTLYVGMGWGQNLKAERLAKADLATSEREVEAVHAYTTLFSPWLRRLVVVTPDAHLVGFVSTLKPQPIDWREIPRDPEAEALAAALSDSRAAEIYTNFANGPLHAEWQPHAGNPEGGQELRLYDMRFGFPNGALTGLWGMTAILDAESRLVEARRFAVDTEIAEGDIVAMLRAKLGLEQRLF